MDRLFWVLLSRLDKWLILWLAQQAHPHDLVVFDDLPLHSGVNRKGGSDSNLQVIYINTTGISLSAIFLFSRRRSSRSPMTWFICSSLFGWLLWSIKDWRKSCSTVMLDAMVCRFKLVLASDTSQGHIWIFKVRDLVIHYGLLPEFLKMLSALVDHITPYKRWSQLLSLSLIIVKLFRWCLVFCLHFKLIGRAMLLACFWCRWHVLRLQIVSYHGRDMTWAIMNDTGWFHLSFSWQLVCHHIHLFGWQQGWFGHFTDTFEALVLSLSCLRLENRCLIDNRLLALFVEMEILVPTQTCSPVRFDGASCLSMWLCRALKKFGASNGSLILRQLEPVNLLIEASYNVHRLM